MSDDVFLTNGAPGYLEYAGTPPGKCVTIDARPGNLERCRRLEARETRRGFQVHNVAFERAVDWVEWAETSREAKEIYQSSLEAVQFVGDYERDYLGAVAEDLDGQGERASVEQAYELGRKPAMITRDIVDMVYDDGLTPKELWSSIDGHRVELHASFVRQLTLRKA